MIHAFIVVRVCTLLSDEQRVRFYVYLIQKWKISTNGLAHGAPPFACTPYIVSRPTTCSFRFGDSFFGSSFRFDDSFSGSCYFGILQGDSRLVLILKYPLSLA